MKASAITGFFLIAAGLLLYGCKKHTNSLNPVIASGMSAKVNGTAFTATVYYAHIDTSSTSGIILDIFGWDTTSNGGVQNEIELAVNGYNSKTGVYSVPGSNNNSALYCYNSVCTQASAGAISLTQISTTSIQGTFSFAIDSFQVANGQFNVLLQ